MLQSRRLLTPQVQGPIEIRKSSIFEYTSCKLDLSEFNVITKVVRLEVLLARKNMSHECHDTFCHIWLMSLTDLVAALHFTSPDLAVLLMLICFRIYRDELISDENLEFMLTKLGLNVGLFTCGEADRSSRGQFFFFLLL